MNEELEKMEQEGKIILVSNEGCRKTNFPSNCYIVADGVFEIGWCVNFNECWKLEAEEELLALERIKEVRK